MRLITLFKFLFACLIASFGLADDLPPAMTPQEATEWLNNYDPEIHGQIDLGNQTSTWHRAYRGFLNIEAKELEDMYWECFSSNVVLRTTLCKATLLKQLPETADLFPIGIALLFSDDLPPDAPEFRDLEAAYGDQRVAFLGSHRPTNWVQALAVLRTSPVCFDSHVGAIAECTRVWEAAERVALEAPEKVILEMLNAHEPVVRVYGMMANASRFGYRDWEKIRTMIRDPAPVYLASGWMSEEHVGKTGGRYYLRLNKGMRTGGLDLSSTVSLKDQIRPAGLLDALPEDLRSYARSYLEMK